jgi:hypothetical protein
MKRLANYLIAMALMAFTFTSCEDVPNPFGQILPPSQEEEAETIEPAGSNTKEDPYNVAAIQQEAAKLGSGETSTSDYWFKGKISSIKYTFNAEKGTATFYISDDGTSEGQFYIYSCLYLGNKNWAEGDTQIKEGDEVIIFGKLTNYNGTLETASKKAYIYSLNNKTEGGGDTPASGDATKATIKQFLDAAESTSTWYELTGTVSHLEDGTYNNSKKYGNFDLSDETGTVYVYGVLSEKGGSKGQFEQLMAEKGIKDGCKITIIGNRGAFNGTPQVINAYFVKIEDGSGGGDTPAPTGDNLIANGDFESWTGNAPDNWNGVAGNATLEKSTDVHGGSAALLIKSNSANKRLSYKAIKLKKGTYNISLYAKAVTGTSKIAPGYVAIINGAPDSQNYMYIETYPEVGTSWTKVEHSFTLNADTEVCLVIMKHKSTSNDVIIDDYSLTSSDGGLIDGGDTPGGGDTPAPTGAYLDESFANGKGNFTIDDKVFSGVWTAASYGSDSYMMATSYVKADGESAKTNHDAESWLISPEIDLSSATNPVLTFAQVINKFFGTIAEEAMVFAKKGNGNWTKLTITYPATPSSSFSKFTDDGANVSVSLADYKSSKTQIAFVYKGSSTKAGTWEIKDVKVAEAAQ